MGRKKNRGGFGEQVQALGNGLGQLKQNGQLLQGIGDVSGRMVDESGHGLSLAYALRKKHDPNFRIPAPTSGPSERTLQRQREREERKRKSAADRAIRRANKEDELRANGFGNLISNLWDQPPAQSQTVPFLAQAVAKDPKGCLSRIFCGCI